MTIRTCLVDMGNVLLYFSHERMCEQIGRLYDRSAAEMRDLLLKSGLQETFERGRITEIELQRTLEQSAGKAAELVHLRTAGSDIFRLNEPMVPLLDALRSLGIRLVLFSNTSISHYEFVRENYNVLDRFDDIVASFQVGALKPERGMFDAALARIDCRPEECLYTDDIAEYIAAGRAIGLQAEVFTGAADFAEHLRQRGVDLGTLPPASTESTSLAHRPPDVEPEL